MKPLSPGRRAPVRRLVLVVAVVAASLAAVWWPHAERAHVGGASPRLGVVEAAHAAEAPAPPKAPAAPSAAQPETPPAPPVPPAPPSEATDQAGRSAEITIDDKGIRIERPSRGARSARAGSRIDPDVESIEGFFREPGWISGLVFMTVALVFVVPLLAIGLVVWYKMRRTRMLNETMVKLAEKGVVPPNEAMEALGAGAAPAAAYRATAAAAPLYEQAKAVRKRTVWSDLRKGVLIGAAGLGTSIWSWTEDGYPNWLGLTLLFVGIGYVVLWYFEERQMKGVAPGARDAPPGGG